jgi:hypothetical protein
MECGDCLIGDRSAGGNRTIHSKSDWGFLIFQLADGAPVTAFGIRIAGFSTGVCMDWSGGAP